MKSLISRIAEGLLILDSLNIEMEITEVGGHICVYDDELKLLDLTIEQKQKLIDLGWYQAFGHYAREEWAIGLN